MLFNNIPQEIKSDLLITPLDEVFEVNYIEDLAKKDIKTVFVGHDVSKQYMEASQFKKLDALINKGYSVFLFGNRSVEQLNKFYDLTRNSTDKAHKINDRPSVSSSSTYSTPSDIPSPSIDNLDSFALGYVWVTKNRLCEYITGENYFDKTFSKKDITKKAIVSAWHRQQDSKISYVIKPLDLQNELNAKLSSIAQATDWTTGSLELGDGWQVWGWRQKNWYCEYGALTEWHTWADLWQNGQPYLAYAARNYLDPEDDIQNWGFWYGGDMDYYVDYNNNKLFDWGPTSSPATTTYTYSIGSSLSGTVGGTSGLSGTIGGSCDVGITSSDCDVWAYDESAPSTQECWVWIGYKDYNKTPFTKRDYVIQTSRQNFSIVIQADQDEDNKCKVPIYNRASYYKIGDRNDARRCGSYTTWTLTFHSN